MKIQKFEFKKSDLNLIPENERVFFIQILNLLTEINVLIKMKCFYLKNIEDEITKKSIDCHKVFLTLITAGKLYEGWMILKRDYFGRQVSRSIEPHISCKGKMRLEAIKGYFKGQNNLERIRNKFAFHADSDEILRQLNEFKDDEPFEFYWSEYVSNCFSTTYFDVLKAILGGINMNEETASKELFNNISEITVSFREFIGEIVQYFVEEYLGEEQIVSVPEQEKIYNDSLPYFCNGEIVK